MNIEKHINAINDAIIEHNNRTDAQHEVRRYCEENDLDPRHFEVIFEYDEQFDFDVCWVEFTSNI